MFGYSRDEAQFTQIPQLEDCESLNNHTEKPQTQSLLPSKFISQIFTTVLLLVTLAVGAVLGAWLGGNHFIKANEFCIHQVSRDSPLLQEVDISFSTIRFNGSLLHENIFRQQASPAVDAAWQSLGVDYRSAIVPANLAAKAGLAQSQVQVAEKYGGGFPANVEGLHHLHCLNLLRQSLYFNFDYYHERGEGAFMNDDKILRYHITHCLDIIRQQLMCTVDIGVLGQIWWNRAEPSAYVDFNTLHKCRNFDAVRQWAYEHQAPDEVPEDYLQPPRGEDVLEKMP